MKDFKEVREKLGGLKGLMRLLGDAPAHDHKWKSMDKCPFCSAKGGKAAVWEKNGSQFFKCHAPGCSTGGEVVTEIGYVRLREGLSDVVPMEGGPSPAYKRLLELAGCWEEPKPPGGGSTNEKPDEEMIQWATLLVRLKMSTSVRMLQDEMKVGQSKVIAILNELQKRGVVGAPRLKSAREILPWKDDPQAPGGAATGGEDGDTAPLPSSPAGAERPALPADKDLPVQAGVPMVPERDGTGLPSEQTVAEAVEVFRMLPIGSLATSARLQKYLKLPPEAADALIVVLRTRGYLNPLDETAKLPEKPPGLAVFKIDDNVSFEWLRPLTPVAAGAVPPTAAAAPADPANEVKPLRPGLRALRWLFEQLKPTDVHMSPFLPGGKVPDPLPNEAVRRLKFQPVPLYAKRGLTTFTCEAMAFRANPRTNEMFLKVMPDLFPWDELEASGLWLPADAKRKLARRPNTQFCGKGQVGRKPEEERRHKDDKWQWGWCEPVLIPYFDSNGELVKLRPHKGGASGHTAAGCERIYIPRVWRKAGDTVEEYPEVVICEGEFKAVAIWQTIGAGADDLFGSGPMGVCALPGITFAKSVEMREELDEWLREVKCKKIYVAFDDEDNSSRPLRQRFDAQIYARFLAVDLSRKLHVTAVVVSLPKEWRNEKKKADWDGALAKLIKQEETGVAEANPNDDEPPMSLPPGFEEENHE